VSSDLQKLRTQLVDFAALLELELDFGEEDVTFADRKQLLDLVVVITQHLQELYESFAFGNAVKQGINVVIAGSPNAGKSTLLNTLLNDDRALVSEIAGTTRDTIEEVITINGFIFRFIDTAGLRTNTEDTIEQMGIKKTESEIKKARILLYLFDAKNQSQSSVEEALSKYKMDNLKIIAVANKSDLIQNDYELELSRFFINNSVDFIALSAKDKTNINALKHTLTHYIKAFAPPDNQAIVYNERHQIELKKSITSMHEVAAALHNNTSTELVAIDLRVALQHIGYITGEVDIDKDILASIFSKFCIGK
jgi:tRNA modification GTPase